MKTQKFDALNAAATDEKLPLGHGKNFSSLVSDGSWTIAGFSYGKTKCTCCGRPICRILKLRNEAHREGSAFSEVIEIGLTCGPKVFMTSCVGFYNDPLKEWERQYMAWKDYINYIILCVQNEKIWNVVPQELRRSVDDFLESGYKSQQHSGGWWMVKNAKKRVLRKRACNGGDPSTLDVYREARSLLYSAKKNLVVPANFELLHNSIANTIEATYNG